MGPLTGLTSGAARRGGFGTLGQAFVVHPRLDVHSGAAIPAVLCGE